MKTKSILCRNPIAKKLTCGMLLFTFGGLCYGLIEILWRRYTHWSMVLTGGSCFLILYNLFSRCKKMSLFKKCICGSLIITSIEFVVGCIVNLWLKMSVWDYSYFKINLLGQVCLLYSTLWALLCIPVSFLCKGIKKIKIFS